MFLKIIEFFKDILAPKKCYSCLEEGYFLCKKCFDRIGHFESVCPVCKKISKDFSVHPYCQKGSIFYDKIIILTHYKNPVIKKLILDSKFYHKKDILKDLGFYLGNKLFDHIEEKIEDLIFIQTPIFFLKKLIRGFNQSEVLVKSLSENFGVNYNFKLVRKIKPTKPQSRLSKLERIKNLKGSLKINKELIEKYKDKTFVVVDDVVSTGTTLNEISKLLKGSGVKKVYGLSIASD